ncbi:tryptophan--tRNA ligase [Thalassolituus hydrocarboniclasticus]|uniref:Tryptophan--tRNA ligase n=2 Tax=Thalassolituus hydrocarboniclasticus TaxID=2742796 RepID=A0ABY6ADD6_9GAMM|nr:tryptophan--tRNA ligase [Thalassolituus hydrocarboniclasticus]
MSSVDPQRRVVSGMRPTGQLHLGHYHGVLKNWVKLQHEFECFFFIADWHALSTDYETATGVRRSSRNLLIDWLAAGVNPGSTTLFVQSQVPELAELHLLLSMITPTSWLERVPGYKDQQEKLQDKNLSTYGFLGYPLLQSADILAYRAGLVPVGGDQEVHIEIARDIARRFNHLYGREPGFEANALAAVKKLGKKTSALYQQMRTAYISHGDVEALQTAQALVKEQSNLTLADKERLLGYLEGTGKNILTEPRALLTSEARMPGLDGQKMSKSYSNMIPLRAEPDDVVKKVRSMQTDPARIRLSDAGDPEKCPVWHFHKIYSDEATCERVQTNCRSAAWGCLECKQPVTDAIIAEQAPIRERAQQFEENPELLTRILTEGSERARDAVRSTMADVREAMGLGYR